MPASEETSKKPAWLGLRAGFVGLLLLSGLVVLVTHLGELTRFAELLRQAEPAWLLLALVLQAGTYVSVASVWYLALGYEGQHQPLHSLIPLGVAKLFSDQVMPSAGMSGTAFFIAAVSRRGVPPPLCLAALLLSVVSFYAAYLGVACVSILILWLHHAIQAWILAVAGVFCLLAVAIPAGALWVRSLSSEDLPALLLKIPGLARLMGEVGAAPRELLRRPGLLISAMLLHGSVFMLDAATLWVMLQVVGIKASFWIALPSFVMASMVTTIGPIPMGLGTFEVTCVSMLGALGIGIEAALTATLLLRGFTLWMPILPGMWLARRALR